MITWEPADVISGPRGPFTGVIGVGRDHRYLVSHRPGAPLPAISRVDSDHWKALARGEVGPLVADIATTITEVASIEEGQRLAEMYEAGIDDPDRPAWQHVPAA